jgi:hypothetical protein
MLSPAGKLIVLLLTKLSMALLKTRVDLDQLRITTSANIAATLE